MGDLSCPSPHPSSTNPRPAIILATKLADISSTTRVHREKFVVLLWAKRKINLFVKLKIFICFSTAISSP